MASRRTMPCGVVIAQAVYSVWPTKYMLSNTFCGAAYQVSRAGATGGPPARRPPPPPAAGAAPRPAAGPAPAPRTTGGFASCTAPVQTHSNSRFHSVPAAPRAASMCFWASVETFGYAVATSPGGGPCASRLATPRPQAMATIVPAICFLTSAPTVLFPLRLVHVRALTEERLRALHQRLRQRRVRVDHQLQVFRRGAHLDRQHALGNQDRES